MSDKAHPWARRSSSGWKRTYNKAPSELSEGTIEVGRKPKVNKEGLHHVAQVSFRSGSSWAQHHRCALRREEARFFQVCGRRGFIERRLPEFAVDRIRSDARLRQRHRDAGRCRPEAADHPVSGISPDPDTFAAAAHIRHRERLYSPTTAEHGPNSGRRRARVHRRRASWASVVMPTESISLPGQSD